METREKYLQEVRLYVLCLNPMDGSAESAVDVAVSTEYQRLVDWYRGQFNPGGHWRENESLEESLKREIKEETGINCDIETGPFMVIEEYYNNYLNLGNTRCNKIYYYIVHSNDGPKIEEMSLSELEQKTDFHLFYIPIKDMKQFLQESIENASIEKEIGEEMLAVMEEYQEKYKGGE